MGVGLFAARRPATLRRLGTAFALLMAGMELGLTAAAVDDLGRVGVTTMEVYAALAALGGVMASLRQKVVDPVPADA